MFGSLQLRGLLLMGLIAVTSGIGGYQCGFAAGPQKVGLRIANSRNVAKCPLAPSMKVDSSDGNVIEEYKKILKELDENPAKPQKNGWFKNIAQQATKLKTCETDYDCNPAGRNYPLRCVNFVVANFCVDSDDWTGGNGIREWTPQLAPEPIPVRIDDGYITQPGESGWPGQ
mmetsp:Transcript_62832/g.130633  ORF Transcript_62832/g.130633 Transcript_62832/m.130633 type:complete len:172 (-) Transcript_62832:263-778(-)